MSITRANQGIYQTWCSASLAISFLEANKLIEVYKEKGEKVSIITPKGKELLKLFEEIFELLENDIRI